MRFNKVVYFRYMPLTAKVYEDFYMNEVESAGIDVEYWDLTSLFFKKAYSQEDSSSFCNTKKITSYKELENTITAQNLKNVLFVSIVTFEGRVAKLFKIFSKYNCIVSVFGRNIFPISSAKPKTLSYFKEKLRISKIKNYLFTKYLLSQKAIGSIKPYDIMFLGGDRGWQGLGYISETDTAKAEIIKVNSNDYDVYMSLKNSKPVLNHDYILFLDEYLPLHPDALLFKIKNVSPEQYYPELNRYFERVEQQFGIPVVVAAHPKALRYRTEDFFNGRKVYFNKTSNLSEHAQFVLAHDTTSINYPIAFGKKIHFITSSNICKNINSVHRNVIMFANFLGCNIQWFDKKGVVNLVEEVPVDSYNNYKYLFQTSLETENNLSKDIFIAFLKNKSLI